MYYEHISLVQTENVSTKHTKLPPFPTSRLFLKKMGELDSENVHLV